MDLPTNAPLATTLPADGETTATAQTNAQVTHWRPEYKEVGVDAHSEARIALRLLNYPAWHVDVNGRRITPERVENFNQMVIPVAAGYSVIRVRFVRTRDRWIGDAISGVSGAIALIFFVFGRRFQSQP
jgi:hypothetical protein